jgi:RimJ/RimL family protein N-acetyltransferase
VPIRSEDRFEIMKWRNEQIYHLRQNKPLSQVDQDVYFENVVSKLFDQEQPTQLLFSFLENEVCVGYGGLVHINWANKNAEISFIMDTNLEKDNFQKYWSLFLGLIIKLSFEELHFHKIFSFSFDLRPMLYNVLKNSGFVKEAVLKEHYCFGGDFTNVVIYSLFNRK